MKKWIAVVAVVFAFAGMDCRVGYGGDKAFESLDKNRDGRVSQQAYLAAADNTFKKLDKNGDGVLDRKELQALPKSERKNWMATMDKNGDGRIDREEFRMEALKRFDAADRDQNGYLDNMEWKRREALNSPATLIQFSF